MMRLSIFIAAASMAALSEAISLDTELNINLSADLSATQYKYSFKDGDGHVWVKDDGTEAWVWGQPPSDAVLDETSAAKTKRLSNECAAKDKANVNCKKN